jgi:hypothetical protein
VILKGLREVMAQECESKGVAGEVDFRRNAVAEKEGVTGGSSDFIGEYSMGLRVCQWVLDGTVRMKRGGGRERGKEGKRERGKEGKRERGKEGRRDGSDLSMWCGRGLV